VRRKVQEELAPALHQSFSVALGTKGWGLEVDPKDEQTLLFNYPSVFSEIGGRSYVRQIVKIECGARSDRWPVSKGRVVPYVAEAFLDTLPDVGVDVPVLDVERTFWEKALILHAEAHRSPDKHVAERYSRHYADVAALAKSESAIRALQRDDLRARVVAHKSVLFPAAWAKYETAVGGTFHLLPPKERVSELARDYSSMQEMFFRQPLTWSEVLDVLADLEKRINAASRD
jgi:Nucleotidyl transferase AbiEii toxin, Type IV TA system